MEGFLERFKDYGVVTYYTVKIEGRALNEFEHFLQMAANSDLCREHLEGLISFIENIGNRGFNYWNLKDENDAFRFKLDWEAESTMAPDCMWRLYCLPVNENVIIIFGGCKKTEQKVQQCKNCKKPFDEANRMARLIKNAIRDKDLWCVRTTRGHQLHYNEYFSIEL